MEYTVKFCFTVHFSCKGLMVTQEYKSKRERYTPNIIWRQKEVFPSFPKSYSIGVGRKYEGNIFALLISHMWLLWK